MLKIYEKKYNLGNFIKRFKIKDIAYCSIIYNDYFNVSGYMNWLIKGDWIVMTDIGSMKDLIDERKTLMLYKVKAKPFEAIDDPKKMERINTLIYDKWPFKLYYKNKYINILPIINNKRNSNFEIFIATKLEKLNKTEEILVNTYDVWFLKWENLTLHESLLDLLKFNSIKTGRKEIIF